jgi:hypothetical protein
MGYNPSLFRVIGIEKELDFCGLERVAILIRLIYNQVLLPFHIPVVMGRRQYLKIAAFRMDYENFSKDKRTPTTGPTNQFVIALPSNGLPFELKNFEFLENGDSAVIVREGATSSFETVIEQATGFKNGMGVQAGVACLVKRSDK